MGLNLESMAGLMNIANDRAELGPITLFTCQLLLCNEVLFRASHSVDTVRVLPCWEVRGRRDVQKKKGKTFT